MTTEDPNQGLPEDSGQESPGSGPAGDGPDMAQFEADLAAQSDQIAAELEAAKDDLARARADVYNITQEYNNYVRRTKGDAANQRKVGQADVVESLLGVLDDVHAAREADELEGPFAAIATKLEDALQTKFSLERFGAAGEVFDPEVHEALMAQTSPEVEVATVSQVLQPGYRMGEKILRPTKVMVDNPQ